VLSAFGVGLLLGGACSAIVLWLLSGLAEPVPAVARQAAVVLAGLAAVLRDAGAVRFPLPQNRRQVPQSVLQRGLVGGGLQFGFELGTGVRTYVPSAAPYVVAVALLLLAPSPLAALAAGAGFGAGRATTALVRLWSGKGVGAWGRHLEARRVATTVGASAAVLLTLALPPLT
jgi:hypothetical protein